LDEINILSEDTIHKEHLIQNSTNAKAVTYVVRDFGRGTDFVCYDPITNMNGGVVVI